MLLFNKPKPQTGHEPWILRVLDFGPPATSQLQFVTVLFHSVKRKKIHVDYISQTAVTQSDLSIYCLL